MKIIGKTDQSVLLEATPDELAKIAGYRHQMELDSPGSLAKLKVGQEVEVAPMYNYLVSIEGAKMDLQHYQQRLRDAANLLEGIPQAIMETETGPEKPKPSKP